MSTQSLNPIRVLVAEDDDELRELLVKQFLHEKAVKIIAAVGNGQDAVHVCRDEQVDIALLDVEMPGMDGVEAAFQIHRLPSQIKIVMYTAFERPYRLQEALSAGASGFLTKDMSVTEVVSALQAIHCGEEVMSASATVAAMRALRFYGREEEENAWWVERVKELTFARRELYELMKIGVPLQEAAHMLGKSSVTVRVTAQKIYEHFGCRSHADFVRQATLAEKRYKSLLSHNYPDG